MSATNTDFEIRLLNAVRKTLIAVAKDTMTKPGMRHPLSADTQKMITDCLDIISSRQLAIEQKVGKHSNMKPIFTDEQTVQSIPLSTLKKTLS